MSDLLNAIPFNRPVFFGKELDYVRQAVDALQGGGDGGFTHNCQALIESQIGSKRCLLTGSCTHALEMCALLLDIQQGDEVIVPAFTFVSTVNAFALRGATPVFADIRPDTLNLDESQLEALITPRTKAIAVMHYAGVGCEMDQIMDIANKHGIPVVEDNAHGFLGEYNGKPLGSFGCLSTLSFHETKNVSCGEGGALLINDPRFIDRAEIIRDKGTDRKRFFRGAVDKYTWVDLGSSYVLSDFLAAILFAQLEAMGTIQDRRKAIWTFYEQEFNENEWATDFEIQLPSVPGECTPAHHIFYLILPSHEQRNALIDYLNRHNITAVFHYTPLHLSTMGLALANRVAVCPVAVRVSDTLVRLPVYNDLKQADQQRVIDRIKCFFAASSLG